MDENIKKGTTIVGLMCQDGIILAADSRATYQGGFIANKESRKVWKIDTNLGMLIAGSVGDAQEIIRILKLHNEIYKMNELKPLSPKSAVSLLSIVLNNNKMMPFYIGLIVGGIDIDGKPQLYNLDALGGYTDESKFTASGSGMEVALGYLEESYKEGCLVKDSIKTAAKAIFTAMKRDANSGDNVLLAAITKEGYTEYSGKDLEKYTK
ncbi:MAG: proteasome subunit beta [Candidatus Marsarchaeota archaeon]|nr:proteasome subunit beta [Candidatus Marsarchaeota archaeon]MCL5094974.1 proteasome subunit beta [Candidatus Marsarchaeota archaeon]